MVAVQAIQVSAVDERERLEAEMQRLVFRLEDGFEKIARAADNGDDVDRLETFWIQLLGEYERLHNRLAA